MFKGEPYTIYRNSELYTSSIQDSTCKTECTFTHVFFCFPANFSIHFDPTSKSHDEQGRYCHSQQGGIAERSPCECNKSKRRTESFSMPLKGTEQINIHHVGKFVGGMLGDGGHDGQIMSSASPNVSGQPVTLRAISDGG